MIPAEPKPENVWAVVDSREQNPVTLALPFVVDTLVTGDYGLRDFPEAIAIERKSLDDLLGCIGRERERFEREVLRLLGYDVHAIVIEASWSQIEAGGWRSKITPSQALGSLLGWQAKGLQICMVDDHERAGRYISRLLFTVAKRRYREARALLVAAATND
jgi:ERCC4-type nuclease